MGLEELHAKEFVHWDLKAGNILLDKRGYAKIADFGLSGTLEEENVLKTYLGTWKSMAPEIHNS